MTARPTTASRRCGHGHGKEVARTVEPFSGTERKRRTLRGPGPDRQCAEPYGHAATYLGPARRRYCLPHPEMGLQAVSRCSITAPPRLGVVGPEAIGCPTAGSTRSGTGSCTRTATPTSPKAWPRQRGRATPSRSITSWAASTAARKEVFDDLDGYDEGFLRGQTIDFGLRARLNGWSCIAVPDIEFIHNHGLRKQRSTEADSRRGVARSLEHFENKWGFSRIAPGPGRCASNDTRAQPLLWNARWFRCADDPYHTAPVGDP